MAWPTSEDVLRTLPLERYDDSRGKLTPHDVDRMIATWKGKLAPGSTEVSLVANQTGEDAVSRGSRADALEQLATSGYYASDELDVIRAAKAIRDEAYKLVAQYREEVGPPAGSAGGAGSVFVQNLADAPLFGGGYNYLRYPWRESGESSAGAGRPHGF